MQGTSDPSWAAFARLERVEITYDANGRPVRRSLLGAEGDPTVHAFAQMNYNADGPLRCTVTG